ncbi:MAG: tRNA (guanine-N1)-methyltransferase [Bacteroidota bacterium]
MKNYRKLFFILFLAIFSSAYSQTTQKTEGTQSLNNGSIEDQFNYLYKKSGSYQEYKVVKKTNFNKIKSNVLDSLQSVSKKLNESNSTIETQKNEINTLKENLKTTNDNLINITKEKDDISFLGIAMSKIGYNMLMWSMIFGLLLLLLFFIYQYKNSKIVTKQAQKDLNEIEEELDTFKRRSIEREQKVRRELQDEINKQKYKKKSSKE